ncbi:hypothetical protein [Virgibacillus ainsalahensis]
MNFFKKFFIYILFILLFISIYQDLSVGTVPEIKKQSTDVEQSDEKYDVAHVKLKAGDTVLSIVERINNNELKQVDIEQIITDFQTINPSSDPYQLEQGVYYYFPVYNKP